MVRTKEELMNSLKSVLGENTSDDALALLEDVSDTINVDTENIMRERDEWKAKYETNDAEWRGKYRDRFYSDVEEQDDVFFKGGEPKKLTYENLFKTEG